jgi:hypothetical protein
MTNINDDSQGVNVTMPTVTGVIELSQNLVQINGSGQMSQTKKEKVREEEERG